MSRLSERTITVTERGITLPVNHPAQNEIWVSETLLHEIARAKSFDAALIRKSRVLTALAAHGYLDTSISQFGNGVVTPALYDLLGVDEDRIYRTMRPRPLLDPDTARFTNAQTLAYSFGPDEHLRSHDHDLLLRALL